MDLIDLRSLLLYCQTKPPLNPVWNSEFIGFIVRRIKPKVSTMGREITVILYADVVDYSRLMGKDEERTHQQLNSALNLLIEQITSHA